LDLNFVCKNAIPCRYDLALAHTLYCKRFVRLRILKFAHHCVCLSSSSSSSLSSSPSSSSSSFFFFFFFFCISWPFVLCILSVFLCNCYAPCYTPLTTFTGGLDSWHPCQESIGSCLNLMHCIRVLAFLVFTFRSPSLS
jgi:hypothetical protein